MADGSLLFVLKDSGEGRRELLWRPEKNAESGTDSKLGGSFVHRNIGKQELSDFFRRLEEALESTNPIPMAYRLGVDVPIILSDAFVRTNLKHYLVEHQSYWGGFQLQGAELFDEGVVRLLFSSDRSHVQFTIRDADEVAGDDRTKDWRIIEPLEVSISEDSRKHWEKERYSGRVEQYLYYALSRSISPGQEIRKPVVMRDGIFQKRNGQKNIEQEPLFGSAYNESPSFQFLLPSRHLNVYDFYNTLLEGGGNFAFILYGPHACQKQPLLDDIDRVGFYSQRFAILSKSLEKPWVRNIVANEIDVVMGPEERFRDELESALRDSSIEALVVFNQCVAELIGVDIDGIIEDVLQDRKLPVFRLSSSPSHLPSQMDLWTELFRFIDQERISKKNTVNLLGFLRTDDPTANEIAGDLAEIGMELNGFIGPCFRMEHFRRFREAGLTVLNRDELSKQEFALAIKEHGIEPLELLPPFGPSATILFYREIAKRCLDKSDDNTIEYLWSPYKSQWEKWTGRAQGHEAAIIVDPSTVGNLLKPEMHYGIPIVSLLLEFGFTVKILCLPLHFEDDAVLLAKRLENHFSSYPEANDRIDIQALKESGMLPEILPGIKATLVYTEHPPDMRIVKAGKMPFHPRLFEMGFAGAMRSLIRLVRLSENRFSGTFSRRTDWRSP